MPIARSHQILGPLLRATANGDKDAFAELYRLTSGKLLKICLSILPEKADADEALQDAYIVIWRKAALYDEAKSSPITWLSRLARNRTLDRVRLFNGLVPENYEPHSDAHEDPDALCMLIAKQEQERLESCLEQLDAASQIALRGKFLLGKTCKELARAEAVPLSTMKSRVWRGLRILRVQLEMQCEPNS